MTQIKPGGIWSPKGKASGIRRGGRIRQGNGLTASGAFAAPEPLSSPVEKDTVNKAQASAILKDMGISSKADQTQILDAITNHAGTENQYAYDRKELTYQAAMHQRDAERNSAGGDTEEETDG